MTAGAEDGRLKQMNDNKKKISHLKNIDSKLADHILDEIIERYMYLAVYVDATMRQKISTS